MKALASQRPLGGLPIQVRPHGARLAVLHEEHPLVEPEQVKGQGLPIHHGVEADPGAALASIGDEDRPAVNGVVDDVMEPYHADWIGTCRSVRHIA